MENLQNKRPLESESAELGGVKRQKTGASPRETREVCRPCLTPEDPQSAKPPAAPVKKREIRGAEWDLAKKKVQTVYGREFVCFAYLINGACKCPPTSHFSHPEDQRGAFGINFKGTPPPAFAITKKPQRRGPGGPKSTDSPGSAPTKGKPRTLRGPEWEDGVARVKGKFGSDFVCFSYLINGACKCEPNGRYKHPEGQAGMFGVALVKSEKPGGGTTCCVYACTSSGRCCVLACTSSGTTYCPASGGNYNGGGALCCQTWPAHNPYHPPPNTHNHRPHHHHHHHQHGHGGHSHHNHPPAARARNSYLSGPATPSRKKKLLVGEQWEQAMGRVREHFGDDFVCFSYLINGSCRCDGTQKFPHPPGLAGSFGILLLDENTKCFDFNVNGRCRKKSCPSIHEYFSLDEAITRMRVSQCLETVSKKNVAEQALKLLQDLPAENIDIKQPDAQEKVTKLQMAVNGIKQTLTGILQQADSTEKRSADTQLSVLPRHSVPPQLGLILSPGHLPALLPPWSPNVAYTPHN